MRHPYDSSLQLPTEATLLLPQQVQSIPYLTLKPHNNSTGDAARIPIHISSCTTTASSSGPTPPALLIGRQVAQCDVRIDHGSISRKHAALYFLPKHCNTIHTRMNPTTTTTTTTTTNYNNNNKNTPCTGDDSNTETEDFNLILQDLGTKHGCTVNHTRIAANEPIVLYQGDEIQFGKVYEQIFCIRGWTSREVLLEPVQPLSFVQHSSTLNVPMQQQHQQQHQEPLLQDREQRKAEIQAMIESLEQSPSYQKFQPVDDGRVVVGENQTQSPKTLEHPPLSFSFTSQTLQNLTSSFMNDPHTATLVVKHNLPVSCTLTLPRNQSSSSHSNWITALHVDAAGARLLTGTSHGYIHLYDFVGVSLSNPSPFKSILIEEGQYPIQDAAFSISSGGDRIFVATSSTQPTLLDREGRTIVQCTKGDPYVTDMAKNMGHTGPITSVSWHPLGDASNTLCCNVVLSSSKDSSVRIWDVVKNKVIFDKLTSRGEDVIRVKNEKGQRIVMGHGGVTCVTFSPHGREMAIGTACGSIQIWKYGGPYTRPIKAVYHAHGKKNPSTSLTSSTSPAIHTLVYSPNGMYLASRSMQDDTLRIWDVQSLSAHSVPAHICVGDLVSYYEFANCAFRPDGAMVCAGTSVLPRSRQDHERAVQPQSYCRLKFYFLDEQDSESRHGVPKSQQTSSNSQQANNMPSLNRHPILDLPIADGVSIGKVLWHPKLNQILLGLSDGSVQILFDPVFSTRGALLCAAKGLRVKDDLSLLLEKRAEASHHVGEIIAPNAPSFREEMTKRKRERAERKDPIKSHRPEPPARGIKAGEGSSAGLNLSQYLATGTVQKQNIAGRDPREELFKYLEGKKYAESSIYAGDRKILAEKTIEEEEEEERKKS